MGDRIREHRIRAGLSQDALAELVGVSRQAVYKMGIGRFLSHRGQSFQTGRNIRHHGGSSNR